MIERAYGAGQVPPASTGSASWGRLFTSLTRSGCAKLGRRAQDRTPPTVEVMTYERARMAIELARYDDREHTTGPCRRSTRRQTHETVRRQLFLHALHRRRQPRHHQGKTADGRGRRYLEALGAANRETQLDSTATPSALAGPGDRVGAWCSPAWSRTCCATANAARSTWVGLRHLRGVLARARDSLDDVVDPQYVEWDLWASKSWSATAPSSASSTTSGAVLGDPLIEGGFDAAPDARVRRLTAFLRRPTGTTTDRDRSEPAAACTACTSCSSWSSRPFYRGHTDTLQYDGRNGLTEVMALFGRRAR